MKKTSSRFSEKAKETGATQKTLAEKIGPVGKKEEKILTDKSNHHDKLREQMMRREK